LDRVVGLELGADDYVTKPFSPRELVLRVKKLLQRGRAEPADPDRLLFGDLVIDRPRHLVIWRGKSIQLTATEFKLLTLLAQRGQGAISRSTSARRLEYNHLIDTRTVDTHMRRLRKSSALRENTSIPCRLATVSPTLTPAEVACRGFF
jgi:two-component system phosphate regulon response regulator PhoB